MRGTILRHTYEEHARSLIDHELLFTRSLSGHARLDKFDSKPVPEGNIFRLSQGRLVSFDAEIAREVTHLLAADCTLKD